MKPLSNCPPLLVVVLRLPGVQDEERRQQGLGKQPGRRGGQPAGPRGGRARTDGHQRRLHPQVRIASSPHTPRRRSIPLIALNHCQSRNGPWWLRVHQTVPGVPLPQPGFQEPCWGGVFRYSYQIGRVIPSGISMSVSLVPPHIGRAWQTSLRTVYQRQPCQMPALF